MVDKFTNINKTNNHLSLLDPVLGQELNIIDYHRYVPLFISSFLSYNLILYLLEHLISPTVRTDPLLFFNVHNCC